MKRYVVNELVGYVDKYVVEDHADIGDKAYAFSNSKLFAYAYCFWLNLKWRLVP